MSNLHHTHLNTLMGAASLRDPSPLQSTTGTQFYAATVAGHWQIVLDLIDPGFKFDRRGLH